MDENKENQRGNETAGSDAKKGARIEEMLMREAYESVSKCHYREAVERFDELMRRCRVVLDDKQKSLIHSEMGTLYFWLGDYETADRQCENALAYGFDNDQAYMILGRIAVARFQFSIANGYFSKISENNPEKYFGFCLVAIKTRDTASAAAYLSSAAKMVSKNDKQYRVYFSYVELLQGNAKEALNEARAVLSECGKDPFLMLLIAEIFITAGNYGEAVQIANGVLTNCPKNDVAYAIKAHAAYAEENFSAAGDFAREAVNLNPKNVYAKTALVKLAVRSGNYGDAESIGSEILRDSPQYSLGHANLGDVYFIQGRYELAQIEYEQTMELMDSQTKGAKLRQARMKYIEGDFASAAAILEGLVEGYHTYYDDAMCDLALCYDQIGDEVKKDQLIDKMQIRRSFYHRTEKILQNFGEK